MNVKKFVAPTARDALHKVKEILGPDAIILSNRGLPGGGVEIMAVAQREMAAAHLLALCQFGSVDRAVVELRSLGNLGCRDQEARFAVAHADDPFAHCLGVEAHAVEGEGTLQRRVAARAAAVGVVGWPIAARRLEVLAKLLGGEQRVIAGVAGDALPETLGGAAIALRGVCPPAPIDPRR